MGDDSAYWQEPDFLLADIVSAMANKAGMQLGVTLIIKGTVLTGTLVSEREYLNMMTEMFTKQARAITPKPSKEDLKLIEEAFDFNALTEDYYPGEDEPYDEEEDGKNPSPDDEEDEDLDLDDLSGLAPIRHLHLKDPAILSPQPSIMFSQGEASIMRIRLNSVDGWMLGRAALMDDHDDTPEILH
jgi:hypothetical protein